MAIEPLHNENELCYLVSKGDMPSFQILFTNYYGKIYSTALLYTKIHVAAEDIVQQVFLKIWEKRNILATIEKFDNYLFIITRNEVLNWLHKEETRARYARNIHELFEEEKDSPEELLIAKQKRSIIRNAIEQLPPQQQQAYRLSRDGGHSYDEIAIQMGLSISTVKGHISSALKSIRHYLSARRDELLLILAACFQLLYHGI